jgi:hypothetical protein
METQRIFDAITRERLRQDTLKAEGKFRFTLADRPGLSETEKLACLTEELGEVSRAVLGDLRLAETHSEVRKELIELAACVVAWLESK